MSFFSRSKTARGAPRATSREPAEQRAEESPEDRRALGREAREPSQIPRRGWWSILKRSAIEANNDRVMTEAAGITFYALLSLFPALTAMVSIYGLFADPQTVQQHVSMLAGFVPGGGMDIINEQLQRVTTSQTGALGFGAIAGLLVALWSSNQGTKAMFDALNVVYEEKEKRSFILLTVTTLAFTLGALVFTLLSIAAIVVVPVVLNFVGLGSAAEWLLRIARWPLLLLGITVLLAALYRFGPSREKARWRWVTWGSGFAAILWALLSFGFSFYVSNFGNYDATYGSLGAVIGFMTWMWLSGIVVLLGAELNAEMEHQTASDTTTGPEQRMGQRGARMADTVAKS
ncbi:YihY/virulence factor BrkB family protein [Roseomonas sp. M0104]|uniref:YihY/virulence factor BrkB family protein n=1 Tax=Teichococcus coralli TaxID=2545983 RepID=A0A845BH85_9PROT|nr:YihY/virulence factor BrkB family protein [Pseudoroseomonas coralli]MXP64687.1 YihY/virulence factor BrkB family protein [Pseudoroseomonas coralli]